MNESRPNRLIVNGIRQNAIPADDRGLLYGDGLFETIAFVDGKAPLWQFHMQRLSQSCERLFLPMPESELLADECARLVAGLKRAVVRITLTRGSGGQAYIPPKHPAPTRILMVRDYPEVLAGVTMIRSAVKMLSSEVLTGIKHLNRLEQVLIGRECQQQKVNEALVLDRDGYVIEGLSSNLIIEQNQVLIAPGPHPAAVSGVGLAWLKQQLGDQLIERAFHQDELQPDDPIWVINSVAGIRSVKQLDGRSRPRGSLLDEPIQRWNRLFNLVYK